jgi:hypothetical protein
MCLRDRTGSDTMEPARVLGRIGNSGTKPEESNADQARP